MVNWGYNPYKYQQDIRVPLMMHCKPSVLAGRYIICCRGLDFKNPLSVVQAPEISGENPKVWDKSEGDLQHWIWWSSQSLPFFCSFGLWYKNLYIYI